MVLNSFFCTFLNGFHLQQTTIDEWDEKCVCICVCAQKIIPCDNSWGWNSAHLTAYRLLLTSHMSSWVDDMKNFVVCRVFTADCVLFYPLGFNFFYLFIQFWNYFLNVFDYCFLIVDCFRVFFIYLIFQRQFWEMKLKLWRKNEKFKIDEKIKF